MGVNFESGVPVYPDSSENEYDSDEERFRARQANTARSNRVHARAQAETELLHAYRARRRLEEETAGYSLPSPGLSWVGADAEPVGGGQEGKVGKGEEALLTRLRRDVDRWEALYGQDTVFSAGELGTGSLVSASDIPWLPCDPVRYLQCLAVALESGTASVALPARSQKPGRGAGGVSQAKALRRAYAQACLWWHPDKFVQRVSGRMAEAERPAALARVQETFQALSAAWHSGELSEE